jgi:nucleotide-binding universal stress UspA family protein
VEWAADDAARRRAALEIVHVREPWESRLPVGSVRDLDDSLPDHCEGVVSAAAINARRRAPGIDVTTTLAGGEVIEAIMRESSTADEVVLGSRGMGGFAGLVLGSVGMGVAGHAHGPVVVVRGRQPAVRHEIVIGFDGSPASEAAMEYGFAQARARHARVRVVYAWQIPASSPLAVGYSQMLGDIFQTESAEFRQRLEPWKVKHPDVPVTEEAFCGHPVLALCDASRDADLVVVGSRGRGGFRSAMLGSVSHGVLHRARCAVAVVRPREERK